MLQHESLELLTTLADNDNPSASVDNDTLNTLFEVLKQALKNRDLKAILLSQRVLVHLLSEESQIDKINTILEKDVLDLFEAIIEL